MGRSEGESDMGNPFFDETAIALSPEQLFALGPYLWLCAGLALSVIAAGLRASQFAVRSVVVAALLPFVWGLWTTVGEPAVYVFGSSLWLGSSTKGVGIAVGLLGIAAGLFSRSTDREGHPEWGAPLLTHVLGLSLLVGSRDFISFFVALETVSLSGAMMAALDTRRERSLEAGLKYLLMGAFASALFLMGGAWLYGSLGTFEFAVWFEELPALVNGTAFPVVEVAAFLLVLTGLLMKLGAAPFHMWSPDVYQAAPTALAAYLASASKLGIFCACAAMLSSSGALSLEGLRDFLYGIAIVSIVVGSLLALVQQKLRRLLAYSGVANVGYGLLLLAADTPEASGTLLSYFLVYGLSFIAAFALIEHFCRSLGREPHSDLSLEDLQQVGVRAHPWSLFLFAAVVFSVAGMPPLPGFFTKYFLLRDAWAAGLHVGAVFVLLSTLVGVGYYLKTLVPLFFSGESSGSTRWGWTLSLVAATFSLLLVFVLVTGLNNIGRWMLVTESLAR